VSTSDNEKKSFLKILQDGLHRNTSLQTETYLTLMMLAFNKKLLIFWGDERPTIDKLELFIKEAKVWWKDRPKTEVVEFDIDFFFFVLMQLRKFTD
jgi:hypothetical protein